MDYRRVGRILVLYAGLMWLACNCSGEPLDLVADTLMSQFSKSDVVALGEWHWTREDSDLRIRIIRHPQFSQKVHYVVTECGNRLYQEVLDRYVSGGDVPKSELQKVWQDVTSPGGCDSPVYEQFLQEIRLVNRALPLNRKIRVLAGEYPIDWAKVKSPEEWGRISDARDPFEAALIGREILRKSRKALIVYGAGHVYRNMTDLAPRNLISLLDREFPGRVYSVVRLSGVYTETARLERMIRSVERPVLLPLQGTAFGDLDANGFIGRNLPSRWFAEGIGIGKVADACVYSGQATDTVINPEPSVRGDTTYSTEKARRMQLLPRPK